MLARPPRTTMAARRCDARAGVCCCGGAVHAAQCCSARPLAYYGRLSVNIYTCFRS